MREGQFVSRRIRVACFWILVAVLTTVFSLLLPATVLPRRWVLAIVRAYLAVILMLLRFVLGVRWQISGDVAAARGPVLVAAKHQSAFETLILQYELGDPAIILKRELLSVPLFGWVLRRLGHIGVDRSGDIDAARRLLAAARKAQQEGRPVLIFPEGSRREVGAHPDYKAGVELLYAVLRAPCIPVAVNSGRVWPAKSLSPGRGRIMVEFLPAIASGLPRGAFRQRLQDDIEIATSRLLQLPP